MSPPPTDLLNSILNRATEVQAQGSNSNTNVKFKFKTSCEFGVMSEELLVDG